MSQNKDPRLNSVKSKILRTLDDMIEPTMYQKATAAVAQWPELKRVLQLDRNDRKFDMYGYCDWGDDNSFSYFTGAAIDMATTTINGVDVMAIRYCAVHYDVGHTKGDAQASENVEREDAIHIYTQLHALPETVKRTLVPLEKVELKTHLPSRDQIVPMNIPQSEYAALNRIDVHASSTKKNGYDVVLLDTNRMQTKRYSFELSQENKQ